MRQHGSEVRHCAASWSARATLGAAHQPARLRHCEIAAFPWAPEGGLDSVEYDCLPPTRTSGSETRISYVLWCATCRGGYPVNDDDLTAAPRVAAEVPDVTIVAEVVHEQAEREIERAVTGRHGMARKYVRWVRRRHPDATPAEMITMLERHYITAISVAGAAITVGSVAVEVGIALIPGGGVAKTGSKAAAKGAGKAVTKTAAKAAANQTMKAAGKRAAVGVAKTGAQRAAVLLPAGDAQLQFEITALFALAVADIHGLELDQEQAHALVYGLANGRVSQKQVATMATDLAKSSDAGLVSVGQTIAGGRKDWSHWANTLADSLPGGEAQSLVRGLQTGALEDVRAGLDDKQRATVEYGVGALVGGTTRFVFGRDVVGGARSAFAQVPAEFPDHLDIPAKPEKVDDEPNRALEALEDAAKAVGAGVSTGAAAVGTGAVTAAGVVTRPFRRVDLDGDGVPDEPQALTAAKGAATAAGRVARPFRSVDLDGDGVPDQRQAITAVKGVGKTIASPFKPKKRGRHAVGAPPREPDCGPSVTAAEAG